MIYPILGHKMYGWKFVGTEIDVESVKIAEKNVEEFKVQEEETPPIQIIHNADKDSVLLNVIPSISDPKFQENPKQLFDFCMCNPPFFETESEALQSTQNNPGTSCVATSSEMVFANGEIGFIKKIIEDSLLLKEKISWYTTLCGKKSSLKELKQILEEKRQKIDRNYEITQILTTAFNQGVTWRWGLAWRVQNKQKNEQKITKFSTPTIIFAKKMKRILRCSKAQATKVTAKSIFLKLKNIILGIKGLGKCNFSLDAFTLKGNLRENNKTFWIQLLAINANDILLEISCNCSGSEAIPESFKELAGAVFNELGELFVD